MKIRRGFVSNSSSSSFVCQVCGEEYSGMDACLSDAEMSACEAGHTYCDSHALKSIDDVSIDQKRAFVIKTEWDEAKKEQLNVATESEIEEAFEEMSYEFRDCCPKDHCPCCSLKSITTDQLIEYLLFTAGKTRKAVEKDIRTKYKNYDEMKKDIK
jgi:hypothetical protein